MIKNRTTAIFLLVASLISPAFTFAQTTSILQEYDQKDGLFKIDIPDGWRGEEVPGRVFILPPPPDGAGIVIQYKAIDASETPEEIKATISSNLDNIAENKVKPIGGSIIDNNEITIDNVYAKRLYYTISLKGEFMYFFRVLFVNKGYLFSIDYGNPSKEQLENIMSLLDTIKL